MTFLRGVFKCGVFEETTFVWKYHETAEIFIFWQIGEDSGRKGNKVKFVKVLKSSDKSFFLSPFTSLEPGRCYTDKLFSGLPLRLDWTALILQNSKLKCLPQNVIAIASSRNFLFLHPKYFHYLAHSCHPGSSKNQYLLHKSKLFAGFSFHCEQLKSSDALSCFQFAITPLYHQETTPTYL